MKLTAVQEKFILHWGEMGTRWGINRTVAQVHALLFLSPSPLNAEQLAETLGVARSNISNSIRELQSWGIVKLVHVMGDRRDHFESMKDPWEMFRVVLDNKHEVLAHIFHGLFLREGRQVLMPDITYSFYPTYCRLYHVPFETVPLAEDFSLRMSDYTDERARRAAGIIFAKRSPSL